MKDIATIFGILLFICSVGLVLVFYQQNANSQDSVFLAVNETVKTEVATHVSKGDSRVNVGELYLDIPQFEKETVEKLSQPIGSKVTADQVSFRYLKGTKGQIKAVRAMIKAGKKEYKTTIVVDTHHGF
ncbi:hypothetical protein [Enterococcus sp. DIV1420a]|uniref:hypothetical protein n=1 Tax=Enterococcus sp. DIV1420a TaxID=2774672 RepID=UPI0010DD42A9|nr:hypothetical protein [Listeria monocytogenes]